METDGKDILFMNVVEIVFSPTGGTEKAARIIGSVWSGSAVKIDLCDARTDFAKCQIKPEDMVVIAMPSFGGRAPAPAIQRLAQIAGNGARCALVCVYGNRAYEDTLAEMEDTAKACGFRVTAAVAAVAEHSIIPKYAAGRPDASDEAQLKEFANRILQKEGEAASVPGSRPYKKAGGAVLVPKVTKDCARCGKCAENCPVQAISPVIFASDAKKCISCMRCVRRCPNSARKVSEATLAIVTTALRKSCSVRKENELFL